MKTKIAVLFSLLLFSPAFAQANPTPVLGQTVNVSGVLIGPIFGPGGATTGLAIYDHLNGNFIAEVRDGSHSKGRFVVDPCSTTYQPVLVTGKFAIEDLGPEARSVKVLEAQSIQANGPRLSQDIHDAIASGLCPLAGGHEAFLNLEAAYPGNLTGTYKGSPCTVTVTKTAYSLTVQVQSSTGGTQTCTLDDNDPKVEENANDYRMTFSNGAPGTFATPNACSITTMTGRDQRKIVYVSTSDFSTASCTL